MITLAVSLVLFFGNRRHRDESIATREGFLLVTLAWVLGPALGALPFVFSHYFPSFIDAFFESVSGFTTTGASVLADVEKLPRSILFWRAFIQWIGGMGIIVMGVAILPQLAVGGIQLIKNETPGPVFEQLKPRIQQTALTLWKVYMLVTAFEVIALWALGMPLFD
ncbi:MAG: TrkH family potassium uptake protein, partial [candidate division Zixibacteria bacterium]|nr:TrkH family potassium uptake protein [candidate division Zixibacteria bacterium]